jgi:hypothetical protein
MVFWLLNDNNLAMLKTFWGIKGGLLKENFYFVHKRNDKNTLIFEY